MFAGLKLWNVKRLRKSGDVDALIKVLQTEKHLSARVAALEALADLGGSEASLAIERTARGADQELARAAARALGTLDAREALRRGYGAPQPANLINRGNELDAQGQHPQALELYAQALKLSPDLAPGWFNQGNTLLKMGRLDQALISLNRALEIDPEMDLALAAKAATLRALGRGSEALATYDQALKRNPDNAIAWYNRGNLLAGAGELAEAEASFLRAVAINPRFVQAWENLGMTLIDMNRPQKAAEYFQAALEVDPTLPNARAGLAMCQSTPIFRGIGCTLARIHQERILLASPEELSTWRIQENGKVMMDSGGIRGSRKLEHDMTTDERARNIVPILNSHGAAALAALMEGYSEVVGEEVSAAIMRLISKDR